MAADMPRDCSTTRPLLGADEALARILSLTRPLTASERVTLAGGRGRMLAEDIISAIDVPSFDSSAMDGLAFSSAAIDPKRPTTLAVMQRIRAGDPQQTLQPGTAARINTGAPIPAGADTVVPREYIELEGDGAILPPGIEAGANIRRRGEELRQGDRVLPAGQRLGAQHVGMLATLGVTELRVRRRPRVALYSTGDELLPPGEPLHSGQRYDANRYALAALLEQQGCEIIATEHLADDLQASCDALTRLAAEADLVVSSGGVSVGDADHIAPALEKLGRIELWRIAIKPGKPLLVGEIGETPFFGLPGNPVAAFITFCLFVRPALLHMQGATQIQPRSLRLPAWFSSHRADRRRTFLRARIESDERGRSGLVPVPRQGAHMLSSLLDCDGLLVIPEDTLLDHGDLVTFLPLTELTCQ